MVKTEVKTPNKRKSVGNDTPAKKPKIENGKNSEKTPKKQFFTPKNNQQARAQKLNKKNKLSPASSDSGSPKKVKPFPGKQVDNKKQNKVKKEGDGQSPEIKKKRRNQYEKLIASVKSNPGSKDPELLKSLNEKINAIKSRPELTKTAKRKLAVLQKLKVICEEGADAAAAKSKAKAEAEKAASKKGKTDKKAATRQQGAEDNKKKPAAKASLAKVKSEEEDDDEDSDEEESDAEESGEEDEDDSEEEEDSDAEAVEQKKESSDEEEDDDDNEDDDEEGSDDDDDDDETDEEAPAPKEEPPAKNAKIQRDSSPKTQGDKSKTIKKDGNKKQVDLDQLKSNDLVTKGQKRFVLFIGNIPYDTTREDLKSHFSKAGEILHIRIPTEKGSNRPRGFGYIEVRDEITYQKCLSMHHSQIKGRRINVLYTQGGKKKGEDKKKQIKVKNMKLHGLRTQGKLAGSVKQSQKRSFRRNKSKDAQKKSDD